VSSAELAVDGAGTRGDPVELGGGDGHGLAVDGAGARGDAVELNGGGDHGDVVLFCHQVDDAGQETGEASSLSRRLQAELTWASSRHELLSAVSSLLSLEESCRPTAEQLLGMRPWGADENEAGQF